MKKKVDVRASKTKAILLTVGAVFFVLFILLPISLSAFDGDKLGNVAHIEISGPITGSGGKMLGQRTVSSKVIAEFIEDASESLQIEAIVLEINSPGGSAVASDEIAAAVKNSKKPVVSVIREVGASGGYWIASATDHIIANRMSITGSIGVISSYLEFSGLMDDYGVGYERLVAGKYKDMGSPFQELSSEERVIMQKKLDRIHTYFIEEIAVNRDMPASRVRQLATGEFYLGVEALNHGLVDELGDLTTAEEYLMEEFGLRKVDYREYQMQVGFFEALSGVFSDLTFSIGEGIGSVFFQQTYGLQT